MGNQGGFSRLVYCQSKEVWLGHFRVADDQVNHIIMSTTHHQVVGTCNSSEACEFAGENTLGNETHCFFRV